MKMSDNRNTSRDSFGARRSFALPDGSSATMYDVNALARAGIGRVDRLPFSIRILLVSTGK